IIFEEFRFAKNNELKQLSDKSKKVTEQISALEEKIKIIEKALLRSKAKLAPRQILKIFDENSHSKWAKKFEPVKSIYDLNKTITEDGEPFEPLSRHKLAQKKEWSNSLQNKNSKIAEQWDGKFNKNLPWTPHNTHYRGSLVVYWKCPAGKDHVWQSSVRSRTSKKAKGCPFCENRKVSETNSLANRFPQIAKYWMKKLFIK
ncbi:hypothetical protein MHBO_002888, partial [Bonamia ostreae]